MKTVIKYQLVNGKIPFDEWFYKLDNSIKTAELYLEDYKERSK